MSDGKNRFNLFKKDSSKPNVFSKLKNVGKRNKIKSKGVNENKINGNGKDKNSSGFASFDSIIPESSPLKQNSNDDSGFYNDDLLDKGDSRFYDGDLLDKGESNRSDGIELVDGNNSHFDDIGSVNGRNSHFNNADLVNDKNSPFDNDLDGVDEKYAKYIYSDDSNKLNDSLDDWNNLIALDKSDHLRDSNYSDKSNNLYGSNYSDKSGHLGDSNYSHRSGHLGDSNYSDKSGHLGDSNYSQRPGHLGDSNYSDMPDFLSDSIYLNNLDELTDSYSNNGKLKNRLLGFKKRLSNKDKSSKNLFGKVTFILIALVLISSIFYFFVYQPFQNELDLERNSKLNELNALYKGPLTVNENYYTLENQINNAYDVEDLKSIDILRFATKDWRMYHSSKIVSCKDGFGRVMMAYGGNKNIIMSVKDANDFVKDNDAKILSNVQFEKVNTVIVPISISRLQATAGLISVGSVVDIYSLSDNSSDYGYDFESENGGVNSGMNSGMNEGTDGGMNDGMSGESIGNESNLDSGAGTGNTESGSIQSNETPINMNLDDEGNDDLKMNEGPLVSGATVLAILRSKDSGLIDSTVSKSNTVIEGNETNPFENTSTFSSDVEELLKTAVLNSNGGDDALDSYLNNYGVRLSNFERLSNIGDLDSNYLVLLEVPQSDVNFVINNMDNLILTIPTDFAPNWVVNELSETYYENLYENQTIDLF